MSIKKFTSFLSESQLLLEYDAEKTWNQHGKKAVQRASDDFENDVDDHPVARVVHSALHGSTYENPYALHTKDSEGEDVINMHNHALLDHLEKTDPTPNKKYVQHIARIYGGGGVHRLEDLHSRMKPALAKFDELSTRKILPADKRDLGRYKSLSDIEDVVDAHSDKLSGKQEDRNHHEEMKKQATITDHPDFTHIIPHTQAAATHFGRGTRWCTTSDNADEYGQHDSLFSHYNEEGPLHILIPKNPRYAGEKYQYHHSSNQFMNERDEPIYHGDPPGGQPHEAIRKWRSDYDASLADAAKTPDAMNHRESSVRDEYLRKHASEDHINKLLKTGDARTFSAMTYNSNFPHDAVKTVLDHNKNENTRVEAITSSHEKPDDITRVLSDPNEHEDVAKGAVVSLHSDSDHVYMGLKHPNENVRRHTLSSSPMVDNEHVRWAAKNGDEVMQRQAARHANADEETLLHLAHSPDWHTAYSVQNNHNATDKVREMALTYPHKIDQEKDPYASHPLNAALDNIHRHTDPEEFKLKVLDHPNSDLRYTSIKGRAASPKVLYKALDDKNPMVRGAAASNSGVTGGIIDKALEKGHYQAIVTNNHAMLQRHHLDKIINEAPHVWRHLVKDHMGSLRSNNIRLLQPHHIDKMLDTGIHDRWDYATNKLSPPAYGGEHDRHTYTHLVMHSPNASSENIDKALEHSSPEVRFHAMASGNATAKHTEKGVRDERADVAAKAAVHKHAPDHVIEYAVNHPAYGVMRGAINNPNAKEHHFMAAINHEHFDKSAARDILLHRNATRNVMDRLAAHPDESIKSMAERVKSDNVKGGMIKEGKMSFKNFITESTLLLEYDAKKTWANHGEKALNHFKNNEENLDHPVASEIAQHVKKEDDKKAGKTLLKHFEETDPTPNKKYVQHIARIYGGGGVNRFEDLHSRMKPALEKFHDLVHRKVMPAEHRDIGRLKTLDSIEDLNDAHGEQLSGKEQSAVEHNEMKGQATIKDHEHFTQITPHTAAAANHFGKGTRWCTTGDRGESMFSHYNKDGPMHILIPKKPNYTGEKYQYHFASGQFMNEKDSPAAQRGSYDHAMQRTPIANPNSETNSHVGQFVTDYEADAARSIYNRTGLSHPEPKVALKALSHAKDITHDDLTTAMKGGAAIEAIKHPLVHQGHVDQAFDSNNENVIATAIQHHPDMISKNQITKAMSMGGKAALAGIQHPLVDPSHITQALKDGGEAGMVAVRNPSLTRDQLTTALNSKDHAVRKSALKNPSVNSDDLHSALKKDSGTALAALKHPKITSEHVEAALKHPDASVKVAALNHDMATDKIKSDALKSDDPKTRAFMVRNGGDGMAEKGIKDDHELVRWAAVYAKDGEKVLHQAVHDIHPDVRLAAVMHPNAPAAVLEKGAFDNDAMVNAAARGHKRAVHRGSHALIEPKYPVRVEGKTNANYTHVPGHELSDLKVGAIKKFVQNHNKTSSSKLKVIQKGRAGVGNPWSKTPEGKRLQRQGNTPIKHASRVDIYVSHSNDYKKPRVEQPDHIHAFHPMLEHNAIYDSICNKSQESGLPIGVLCEVFDRGVSEWTEQSNKTMDQYAFNRLNSFISGGFARKLDSDLLNEVSVRTLNNYSRKAQTIVDNTPEDSKVHKKSKKGLERANASLAKKLKEETQPLDEMSPALAQKYVKKASQSVKKLQDGEYTNAKDNKVFKRKMYISFAKHCKLNKEENNVVDNSGTELIERTNLVAQEPAKYASVKRRDTKSTKVRSHHTEKQKGMYDHHRTETALARNFVKRGKDNHLVNKQNRHQLTDRWRDVNRKRINRLKGKPIRESDEYIAARQKLHDAHAEASRQMAGMERDPELRRLDLHRAKKHSVASRVLEILKSKTKKK